MSRRAARVLLVATALVGCTACNASTTSTARPRSADARNVVGATYFAPARRDPMPNISSGTLAGPRLSLPKVLGNGLVVVNVWASWCVECRSESQGLASLSLELRDKGVRFVGIDEQDVASKARRFVAATGADYPQLSDTDGRLLSKLVMLSSSGIPSTLVVDRRGRVAARIVGVAREAELRGLIQRVLAEG